MQLSAMLKNMLLVMCGGGLGAASRYAVGLAAVKWWGGGFAWGTLAVNLVGCFLIGLLIGLAERLRMLTPEVRLLLITGYLGGLTTFSAFSLETVSAIRAGMFLQPILNLLANNLGGLFLTYMGFGLADMLNRFE